MLGTGSRKESGNYQFSLITSVKTSLKRLTFLALLFSFSLSFSTQLSAQFTNYCIQVDVDNDTNCTYKVFCDENGLGTYDMGTIGPNQSIGIKPSQFHAIIFAVNIETGQRIDLITVSNCGNYRKGGLWIGY